MIYDIYITETVVRRRILTDTPSGLNPGSLESRIAEMLDGDIEAHPALGGKVKEFQRRLDITVVRKHDTPA